MQNKIDNSVIKYVPVKLRDAVISCDKFERFPRGYTYNVIFEDDETSIFADSVEGLKWACAEVLRGRRGVIYG